MPFLFRQSLVFALIVFFNAAAFAEGIDSVDGVDLPLSAGGVKVASLSAATGNMNLYHGAKIGAVDEDQCQGSKASDNAGLLRYTSTGMQYCDGSVWKAAFSSGENKGGYTVSCPAAYPPFNSGGTLYCNAGVQGLKAPTCDFGNPKQANECKCPAGSSAVMSSYVPSFGAGGGGAVDMVSVQALSFSVPATATFVCQ